jgi:hypothetical protein
MMAMMTAPKKAPIIATPNRIMMWWSIALPRCHRAANIGHRSIECRVLLLDVLPVMVSIPLQHAGKVADRAGPEGRPAASAISASGRVLTAKIVSDDVHAEPAGGLKPEPIGLKPTALGQDVIGAA